MSSPNDPSDQNPQTPENGGFVSPGGPTGASTPPPAASPYGQQPPGAQQYGGQQYGGQQYGGPQGYQPGGTPPTYGSGQPPYGAASGGNGEPPRSNTFGLVGLIIGGVSLILAFVPIINYVSWILALVGLALGIVGLVLKNRKRGLAIAGVITSIIGLVLSIVLAIVYTVGFVGSVATGISDNAPDVSSAPSDGATIDPDARDVDVVYEVSGDGTDVTIVYLSVTAGDSGTDIETLTAQSLPWTQELDATVGGEYDYTAFNVTATNGAEDTGEISCSITVDGEIVAEDTADGAFGIVSCMSSDVG
ncbi:MmpS family membrane protein [Labedella gwakjiensis]|uniref:MmpS family membrane protein n=1 Tax=Labedella gwakjiensis TaxID=390269 RepID=A0A2P8GRQ2_9MICO|nr:MmpS family transport accessory protein [Labedella gwakjiensis]PSL36625.1 MmpS family membrane protein [Labedella gwakjiensis]RUQ84149.1 hypothetical protein ELQ93_15095 [Labedella gwakjiensis]